jgi:hypothetical protein
VEERKSERVPGKSGEKMTQSFTAGFVGVKAAASRRTPKALALLRRAGMKASATSAPGRKDAGVKPALQEQT